MWRCRCRVEHINAALICPECGMEKPEPPRRQAAVLEPELLLKLERLHEQWARGECD